MTTARRKPPSDEQSFLRRFLDNPKRTGAVAPSSPFLAREMARAVDPLGAGLVVELGPGTGPVTKALIARGIPRERLLLVEFDPHFCKLLAERYGASRVVGGDAYALGATLSGRIGAPLAAVVSSLPLLNEKPERRLALIDEAFELLGPDGVFVQFTYGLKSPIPREALAGRYVARSGAPILRNLPPASVWTFRRAGQEPAPGAKVMRLKDHAERLGAEIAARRRKTEDMLGRHGDRVIEAVKREVASLRVKEERFSAEIAARRRKTEDMLGRHGDRMMEMLKREVASLREAEEKLERRGDRVLEMVKREVASLGRPRKRDDR